MVAAHPRRLFRTGFRDFLAASSGAVRIRRAPRWCDGLFSRDLHAMTLPSVDRHVARHRRWSRSKLAAMGNPINRAAVTAQLVRPRRPMRHWVVCGLVGALLVSVTACSDDDTSAADDEARTTIASTTTTQPPATDEASHEIVEELVLEATGLADELFQDPTAVEDPDNEALDRLRELYTEDSPTPDGVEESVRGLADRDERYRPAASGIYREVSIYRWYPATDENTLTFDTCSLIDREKVNAAGEVIDTEARVIFTAGEARRVAGVWRFYGLSSDVSRNTEIEPGQANPGFCQQVPVPEGGSA
jgi:hypothetical protein